MNESRENFLNAIVMSSSSHHEEHEEDDCQNKNNGNDNDDNDGPDRESTTILVVIAFSTLRVTDRATAGLRFLIIRFTVWVCTRSRSFRIWRWEAAGIGEALDVVECFFSARGIGGSCTIAGSSNIWTRADGSRCAIVWRSTRSRWSGNGDTSIIAWLRSVGGGANTSISTSHWNAWITNRLRSHLLASWSISESLWKTNVSWRARRNCCSTSRTLGGSVLASSIHCEIVIVAIETKVAIVWSKSARAVITRSLASYIAFSASAKCIISTIFTNLHHVLTSWVDASHSTWKAITSGRTFSSFGIDHTRFVDAKKTRSATCSIHWGTSWRIMSSIISITCITFSNAWIRCGTVNESWIDGINIWGEEFI